MKKLKGITIILCITLVTSLFGIIAYASANDIDLIDMTYIDDGNEKHNDSKSHFMDWFKSIPFITDGVVDAIEDTVEEGWNNSMNFNFNKHYEKIGDTIENNFPTDNIDTIDITTDIASILFVQEDRTDIKAEYVYTKPDTDNYTIEYDAEIKDNSLNITQHIKTRNFVGNNGNDYKHILTLYVPKDFSINNLYIKNNLGDIKNCDFYSNVSDTINMTASLGLIDINLSNPKDTVKLISSLGKVNLNNDSKINNLDIVANCGDITVQSTGAVKDCSIDADMGQIKFTANEKIKNCDLEANMGTIDATFKKHIDSFNVKCDMGSVNMKLYDNDDSVISTKASMGNIDSDFDTTKKSSPYTIKCSMGDITLTKR